MAKTRVRYDPKLGPWAPWPHPKELLIASRLLREAIRCPASPTGGPHYFGSTGCGGFVDDRQSCELCYAATVYELFLEKAGYERSESGISSVEKTS